MSKFKEILCEQFLKPLTDPAFWMHSGDLFQK